MSPQPIKRLVNNYRRLLVIMMLGLMAISMTAAVQIPMAAVELPTPGDIVEAGKTVGDMSALHLLGTITIVSMILAAFLAYLLYRSQRDQWLIITALKDEVHALLNHNRRREDADE